MLCQELLNSQGHLAPRQNSISFDHNEASFSVTKGSELLLFFLNWILNSKKVFLEHRRGLWAVCGGAVLKKLLLTAGNTRFTILAQLTL